MNRRISRVGALTTVALPLVDDPPTDKPPGCPYS
jgi:hypothetical protein